MLFVPLAGMTRRISSCPLLQCQGAAARRRAGALPVPRLVIFPEEDKQALRFAAQNRKMFLCQ